MPLKAAAFVAQKWAGASGLDAADQLTLWPVMLEAAVKSAKWPTAERLGKAPIREIESGKLFARLNEIADEAKVRRLFAEALDHVAKPEEAVSFRRHLRYEPPDLTLNL